MSSRTENYDIPDNYTNLNEIRAPSPVESSPDRQSDTLEHQLFNSHSSKNLEVEELKKGSGQDIPLRSSGGKLQEEDYTIPDDYAYLDEIAAPSPVDTGRSQRQRHLEDGSLDLKDASSKDQAATRPTRQNEPRDHSIVTGSGAGHAAETPSSGAVSEQESHNRTRRSDGHERVSKFMTELYTVSYLVFFSILGTLARLGLQALTFYPGAPVQTGVLWANVGGSLIMGFLAEDRKLFREEWGSSAPSRLEKRNDDAENGLRINQDQRAQSHYTSAAKKEHAAKKKTIPLYIGLATGFCGSFTSFSSFIRDAFLALSNALPIPVPNVSPTPISPSTRNPGYGFLATVAVVIATVGLSLGALQSGAHLALALEPYTPSIRFFFARKIVDRALVLVAWGSWLGAVLLAIFPPDRPHASAGRSTWAQETWRGDTLFALVFAPLGCLLRFYASVHLNGKRPSFPLGTFAVNMFGTAMESVFFDLQHVPVGKQLECQVLQGAMDGFCGCLTTVSTWVAEMKGLRTKHAYAYGAVSVGVGLGLAVVIMGSVRWTSGFKNPSCRH